MRSRLSVWFDPRSDSATYRKGVVHLQSVGSRCQSPTVELHQLVYQFPMPLGVVPIGRLRVKVGLLVSK